MVREKIAEYSIQLCENIAAAYGLRVDARFDTEYPVTVNNADEHDYGAAVARRVLGEERVMELANPVTGAEAVRLTGSKQRT